MEICHQCNGFGYLWQDRYFQLPCWRCVGKGQVGEISAKDPGKISPEAEGGGIDGIAETTKEETNEGNP